MSSEPRQLGMPTLSYRQSAIATTVRGIPSAMYGQAANHVALGMFARRIYAEYLPPNTNAVPVVYTPSTSARFLVLAVHAAKVNVSYVDDTLTLTTTIKDAAGHSVGPSSALIAAPFDASTLRGALASFEDWLLGGSVYGPAFFDLDALRSTLTDPTWWFEFVVARPSGSTRTLHAIEGFELPRSLVDDSQTYGVISRRFMPGMEIAAGPTSSTNDDGFERLLKTVEGGRVVERTYVQCAWPEDTTFAIPQTTSATFAALTNLDDGSSNAVEFYTRIRNVSATSSTGEACRFGVIYKVTGGGTAEARLTTTPTGGSGSTFDLTGLTSATWAWSGWKAGTVGTNGTDQTATFQLTAKTSAGTFYVAAFVVEENVA